MKRDTSKTPFVPYIPASRSLPELTVVAVLLGIVLAIVFGAANAYLGLKIGLTVSASIPAAVISLAILRGLFRRKSILENNIVQTMTTAGEAVAAGAIFTLPALYLWKLTPSQGVIAFITLTGGFLGVMMMVPLRRLLIVNEHETLPYPEGTACAEVLKSGETGGSNARLIFFGFLVGGLFKTLGDGLKWFKTSVETKIAGFKGAAIGLDTMPALLGVGYIIGPRIAGQMVAGGLLASLVFIPMIAFFGTGSPTTFFPADQPISRLDISGIYDNYIRYIGAGAVATGGLITLVRTLPMLFRSIRDTLAGLRTKGREIQSRTDRDIPTPYLVIGTLALILVIAFAPVTHVGIIGAVAIAVFGFLFVAVASRIVGIVGSSSMPVSGMTIATLLIVTMIFKVAGMGGQTGMIASLMVAAIVCVALAVAGDISQDLKTGYLVGGTPWKQQIAMMIGVLASALLIGFFLVLFDQAYGIGGNELPAPKAVLMKIIVEGLMAGNLPWELILIGMGLAVAIEFLGLNSLTVAVGFYLPVSISTPIMIGGLVRWATEAFIKNDKQKQMREETGTLFASGLIAGEALVSVVIALLIVPGILNPEAPVKVDNGWLPFSLFLALAVLLWFVTTKFTGKTVTKGK
ncbi:OPT family oligopeptide transporter [Paenactinomyces guangxiensis]|uniref:Oligopeptide transporter, OPT family n=1 Tax=Paenactinomyces guangxiensis TaxID=1490290 RepID=A0A7W1WPV0_9BACL|nr:oligopeptide transporter, OPT family [Paenactinomyces guangxiensis]MBA4493724.1 oligopeptide transporter, OPT family [Paenactinomyces guangxiensis]MBH8591012.1 oligopeptide transporter, OPT family [Paenactinomyces guangxiensis]